MDKALAYVKTSGLKTMKDDPYVSGRDGLLDKCNHGTGMFKLTDYKDLGQATFKQVSETLMGGQPLMVVLERNRMVISYS